MKKTKYIKKSLPIIWDWTFVLRAWEHKNKSDDKKSDKRQNQNSTYIHDIELIKKWSDSQILVFTAVKGFFLHWYLLARVLSAQTDPYQALIAIDTKTNKENYRKGKWWIKWSSTIKEWCRLTPLPSYSRDKKLLRWGNPTPPATLQPPTWD